mgnify:FL=1|tara:strand:+ start:591 stop:941 length:351 start_codon:yes stop_codon:yes gene_type:complete
MSKLEALFERQLTDEGISFQREATLIPKRRFRFDFVFPEFQLVVEVEGGTWSGGRHTSGVGFQNDCIKYNLALENGWRVLRFTSNLVKDRSGIEQVKRIMGQDHLSTRSGGVGEIL